MEFDFSALLASPAGLAIKGALVAAFLDFAVGALFAAKNGTFALDSVAAFVRKHLLGRVFPITALLMAGSALEGDAMGAALTASGLTAATAYAAETIGSVMGSVNPPKPSEGDAEATGELIGDPVPKD